MLLLAKARVLSSQGVPGLGHLLEPGPGAGGRAHRNLDRIGGSLKNEAGALHPAVTLVEEHDHQRKNRVQREAETQRGSASLRPMPPRTEGHSIASGALVIPSQSGRGP